MSSADLIALSPLLILLFGALGILLLESFGETHAKKLCRCACAMILISALIAAFFSPKSENTLLTDWMRFDRQAFFFQLLFLAIGCCVFLLSLSFFRNQSASEGEYYFLLLCSLAGLILISAAADFLLLFLGLETLSISLYILCAYMKRWGLSAEAAIKYFLMGAIAAAFLLYGIALIYGAVGSTRLDTLMTRFQQLQHPASQALFLAGIALVTLGLAFKAVLVPFHLWAPDVYAGASTPVTAFMAVGTKAGAFAAFTLLFAHFLPNFDVHWSQGMALIAVLTLIYANLLAMRQQQLRRFFAYSGISHAGFLLIPIVAGTSQAFQAVAFYLVIYALGTFGVFAGLLFIERRDSSQEKGAAISDLQGLYRHHPQLAVVMMLALLTLAGIPPTAGFFAKFFVFKLAFQSGYYLLLIVALLTTILSAYYYLRIVAEMMAEPSVDARVAEYSWPATAVAMFSFMLLLFLTFYPAPLLNFLA